MNPGCGDCPTSPDGELPSSYRPRPPVSKGAHDVRRQSWKAVAATTGPYPKRTVRSAKSVPHSLHRRSKVITVGGPTESPGWMILDADSKLKAPVRLVFSLLQFEQTMVGGRFSVAVGMDSRSHRNLGRSSIPRPDGSGMELYRRSLLTGASKLERSAVYLCTSAILGLMGVAFLYFAATGLTDWLANPIGQPDDDSYAANRNKILAIIVLMGVVGVLMVFGAYRTFIRRRSE